MGWAARLDERSTGALVVDLKTWPAGRRGLNRSGTGRKDRSAVTAARPRRPGGDACALFLYFSLDVVGDNPRHHFRGGGTGTGGLPRIAPSGGFNVILEFPGRATGLADSQAQGPGSGLNHPVMPALGDTILLCLRINGCGLRHLVDPSSVRRLLYHGLPGFVNIIRFMFVKHPHIEPTQAGAPGSMNDFWHLL